MGLDDPAINDSLSIGVAVAYHWTSNLGFEREVSHHSATQIPRRIIRTVWVEGDQSSDWLDFHPIRSQ